MVWYLIPRDLVTVLGTFVVKYASRSALRGSNTIRSLLVSSEDKDKVE